MPIEGEEFTKRLLTPFQETKFLLLRQGYDIDLLLRLMAQELRMTENGQEVAYRNTPADRTSYETFRRVVTTSRPFRTRTSSMLNRSSTIGPGLSLPTRSQPKASRRYRKSILSPTTRKTTPIPFANKSWDERSSPTMTPTRSHRTNEPG